jgi:hypothetical protein
MGLSLYTGGLHLLCGVYLEYTIVGSRGEGSNYPRTMLALGGNVTWREIHKRLRSIRKRYTKFMRGLTWCVQWES